MTLHYHRPVNVLFCIEPCYPEEQKSRISPSINLSVYRALNKNNELKIGVGFSGYRFWEKGLASPGDTRLLPYEIIQGLYYFNFSAGFRHLFVTKNQFTPFFETGILYEMLPYENYLLKNSGIAIQSQAGIILKFTDKWSLIIDGFYKTGIIKYNKREFKPDYIPFGYGIQVGMNLRI